MTGCSAVNARTLSATATAATVPAEILRNCLRENCIMNIPPHKNAKQIPVLYLHGTEPN
jgi:hypothetical protein